MMNRGKGANSDNTDHISFMGMNGGVLSLFVLLICDVLSAEFFFVALGVHSYFLFFVFLFVCLFEIREQ